MAGLNKYSLLNSRQAGPFFNQNRQIDFEIPEGGVYDLSQCFVQLITRCITDTPQVHNMCLRNSSSIGITPKNVDLIRNCWLHGSKVGKLEDITRVNVLQTNLLELMRSTSEKMTGMIDSIYQVRDFQEGMLLSPWVEWHKDGSSPSIYRDNYLRIPLSQLYSLGSNIIDTNRTGSLTVHIELENLDYVEFAPVPLFHSPTLDYEGFMNDVEDPTNLITTVKYDPDIAPDGIVYNSVESSPYFVGQKLDLTWNVGGVAGGQEGVTVLSITHNVVDKTITLQLDYTFDFSVVTVYEAVIAREVEAPETFATLSVASANLGVCEVTGGKMVGDALEYMTWSVEQYSNDSNSLEKIFEVESNAVNAFLMFNNNTASLLSTQSRIDEYRMRIDNSDVYDRNIRINYHDDDLLVLCHDPLHYDAINRTMMNSALPLKNLTCLNMRRDTEEHSVTLSQRFNNRGNALMMLCTPLPLTAGSKKLQFSVSSKEAGDRIYNVILFKQIVKMVKLA